jgi:hypothetical protein
VDSWRDGRCGRCVGYRRCLSARHRWRCGSRLQHVDCWRDGKRGSCVAGSRCLSPIPLLIITRPIFTA